MNLALLARRLPDKPALLVKQPHQRGVAFVHDGAQGGAGPKPDAVSAAHV
jgi:hypothetical protein